MDSVVESSLLSANSLVEGEPVTELEISENPHHSEKEEQSLFQEETEEWRMKEETEEERVKRMREEERERKRRDVMERIKKLSLSSSEADEPFSPLSPTLMDEDTEGLTEGYVCSISERTECLSRSVKNSNSVKKTEPPMTISKIDSRLEQYNHAVELSGQEARDTKQVLMDLAASPEPLAARKNLFEVGETWNQNQKVLSTKPNEVKSGDVRLKKTMWETLETSSTKKPEGKASLGKKFKFVETGHGKYEKVLVGDSDSINHTNRKQTISRRFIKL
ncbi:hypothetical protein P4O66_004445 [Electrophorus voltai]|uniref:Lymphocyte specific protein 1 a n=1 Tax=Electrophorus voltai TaxID=2609070 RepID=A0AAD8ZPK1_9TELE|nr:hypothetical protein P4O66_004445 [Electrophorus voltai]